MNIYDPDHAEAMEYKEDLVQIVLQLVLNERGDITDSTRNDTMDYLEDVLAITARHYVEAVDRLDPEDQPVGWRRT